MKLEDIERVAELLTEVKDQLQAEGVVDIIEVSSKTGCRVNAAFENLVDHMLTNIDRSVKTGAGQRELPRGVDIFSRSENKTSGLCCSLL